MNNIIEIVHVSYRNKIILTFSVEISQKWGDKNPSAKATLTHIGGEDRPFPNEPTWVELGNDYLIDYFASADNWTSENYKDGLFVAKTIALSRMGRL